MNTSSFPDGFLWGAATSAYQIEGSPLADGAGPSNWHRFAHTHGMVLNNENGDMACDHYRRFRDDVKLMKELGLQSYRFSISWSRILPGGVGNVNEKGLDFYKRLVEALRENDILPNATLFHWDLPAALEDRGGWLNPEIIHWFAEYAEIMFRTLDDSVGMWTTLNEPWVVSDGGYLFGKLAPGHSNVFEAPIAAHHLLKAHAEAIRAYRSTGNNRVGIVVNLEPKYPASESDEDRAAVRRADAYMNRQFLDPLYFGSYPEELAEIFGDAWPAWRGADMDGMNEPFDFLGINYYTRAVVAHDPGVPYLRARKIRQENSVHTQIGWEVYPAALSDLLDRVKNQYGQFPIYITENGAAFYDPPAAEDLVDDTLRIAYLRSHLEAVDSAIEAGADVRGYYAWSLLDNFEWSEGYSKRFGIVHVDYATQRRTIKASGRFYRDVIGSNGGSILTEPAGLLHR